MSSARHLRHTAAITLVAVVFVALAALGPARAILDKAHLGLIAPNPAHLSLLQPNHLLVRGPAAPDAGRVGPAAPGNAGQHGQPRAGEFAALPGAHWATLRPTGTDLADAPRHASVPATLGQTGLTLTVLALLGVFATRQQRGVHRGPAALPGVRGPPRLA